MPLLLVLDISALSLSLALCSGLLLTVIGTGLDKPLNRSFVVFAVMDAGFVLALILLRLSLRFSVGNPETLAQIGVTFFAIGTAFLLLFCLHFTGKEGWWPSALVGAVTVSMLAFAVPLLEGKLISDPWMSPDGLTFYHVTTLGLVSAFLPTGCLAASSLIMILSWRRHRAPSIALSVLLLLVGFLFGGMVQPHVPLMGFAGLGSLAILGWGIIRSQLFNPLRELTLTLRERARRQELISEIGRQTTTLVPLEELLDRAVALIRAAFDFFTVAVFLVEGDELVLSASTHPAAPRYLNTFRLTIGTEGLCGWVAAQGAPLIVGDVGRDARYVSLLDSERTRSELAVPILRSGRVVGVLDAQSSALNAFDDQDVATLQTIADQLSSSIENARLYGEAQRRAERLALVNRISAAAGAVLDLDDLLETVHREVTPIFEAEAFFIALVDERQEILDFRILVDGGRREAPTREALGDGPTSRVVRDRASVLLNDTDRGAMGIPWGTGRVPTSWVGVPMLVGDRLVGVMSVQTYGTRPYDSEDVLLARTIADEVAVAVENARLYEKVLSELDVRLRTETVLRESEEKFRNLAEESPNMIFIHAGGRITYANRQCEVMSGYPRDILYAPDFDFRTLIAPGYDAAAVRAIQVGGRGGEVPPYELVFVTRDGRRVDAILTTRLIGYEGSPAVLGIVTDITARKRTERLLQSLNAATLAMEQVLSPAEVFPSALRVLAALGYDCAVFMSPAEAPRMLRAHCRGSGGTGDVRVLDDGDGGLLFPYDAAADVAIAMDGRQAMFSTQDHDVLQMFFGTGEETRMPHASRGVIFAPLVVEDQPFGLLGVAGQNLGPEDLQVFTAFAHQASAAWRKTRLVQDLESSLKKLSATQDQLLHSQKMEAVGRLAGGIAHDFNNLLTVISGYTSLLGDILEGNAPALVDLGQIRTTIKRASALTSRLLTFSRKQILQPTVLDLNKVVAGSLTLLRPLIGEDIELVVRLSADSLWVRADHGQLEQVLMNLAVNARDAMPGGGTLVLETSDPGGEDASDPDLPQRSWAQLRVQDDGVGMTEETRAHAFEPFFTTKEEGKGSGLGLSTVYGIVTQAGGRIRVESMPGRGSTFVMSLPRAKAAPEHLPTEDGAHHVSTGTGTVLLVEDEKEVRELTTRVLERGGYMVVAVASAREALLVAEGSTALDLVVTDVVMPGGMSGLEMGERLSRSRPGLPVLYISGYSDDMKLRDGGQGLSFLGKPFQPHELLARVKAMLD